MLACLYAQPRADYFQQEVDYRIDVRLDDRADMLHAFMEIDYTNNAPTPLVEIYLHLWPNAYEDRSTALAEQKLASGDFDFHFGKVSDRGYIDSLLFEIDGEPAAFSYSTDTREVIRLSLKSPLPPGERVTISTPFRVKLPSASFSRLGHVGDAYAITQWYPKPVVYDREGWHPMPYLDQGEFYSEFGSFDVSISLPSNYIVGATGVMDESSRARLMDRAAERPDIEAQRAKGSSHPASAQEMVTHRFVQSEVHDFAWFADKRFEVLHDTLALASGRIIDAWVLHTNSLPGTWENSMEYLKDGVRHYSGHVGEYPYDHITVVDGTIAAGGGMEYPMITIVNGTYSEKSLEQVIVHEVGHNWFYGILGSDERDHPWMDEGVNTFYEVRYFEEKYGRKLEQKGIAGRLPDDRGLQEIGYLLNAREHQDQPLNICSHRYTTTNYGVMVYSKGGLIMQYLRAVLGDELFDTAMKAYYKEWKYRHPSPSDMQQSLENASGQDLSWFFDELVSTNRKIDFYVKDYVKEGAFVTVGSRTSFSGPAIIGLMSEGQLVQKMVVESGVATKLPELVYDEIRIDPEGDIPQIKERNDRYRLDGLLKRSPRVKVKALTGTGASSESSLYMNPMLTWNDEDKWMVGANFSNYEALAKDFEWSVSPMYSPSSDRIIGFGRARKKIWLGEESPDCLTIGVDASRYTADLAGTLFGSFGGAHSYTAVRPSLDLRLIPKSLKSGRIDIDYVAHILYLSGYGPGSEDPRLPDERREVFHDLAIGYALGRGLISTEFELEVLAQRRWMRPSLSWTNSVIYDRHGHRIGLRLHGSAWADDGRSANSGAQRPALSGQMARQSFFNGDFMLDHIFLGRGATDGVLAQQHVRNRGGFSIPSTIGTSEQWVASASAEVDLPLPIPLSVYGSYGLYRQSQVTFSGATLATEDLYEGGIRLTLLKDYIDVSLPLVYSDKIGVDFEQNEIRVQERILFQLRLEKLIFRDITFDTIFARQ